MSTPLEKLKKEFAAYKKKTDSELKKLRGELKSKDPLDDLELDDDSGISFDAIKNQVNRVNALTDAMAQAKAVQQCYKKLMK